MNKEIAIGLLLTAGIAGALAYWYYGDWPAAQDQTARSETAAATPSPADEPIRHPVTAAEAAAPLPALADSDEPFRASLEALYGKPPLDAYLAPRNLIARLVATIDSLDRKAPVAMRTRAMAPVPLTLVVDTQAGQSVLSARNAERYKPLMMALQTVDGKTVAELYLRYYPLFQQVYVELGYPDGYFNDRLVRVIDHLLETPDLKGPHPLVRPTVAWRFADAELEARSSGQKILLRLGRDSARVVKAKLREIRAVIAPQKEPV